MNVVLDDLPAFAASFAATLAPGDRIALIGNLGAGKTTFLFHVLRALGLPDGEPFSSPTFAILNRYECTDLTVHHADFYRLNSFADLESLDILPLLEAADAVSFVEWGDKFPELAAFFTKKIIFEDGETPEERRITFE